MNHWLSYWNRNNLFISSNDFSNHKNEIQQVVFNEIKNYYIITMYQWSLWGIRGLIFDINVQDYLWNNYDENFLMNISNVILNALLGYYIEWICSFNSLYYYDYHNNYQYIKYWDYKINLSLKQDNKIWQMASTHLNLKIGDCITNGIIGNYYWRYETSKIFPKKILLNYKIH